MMSDLSNELRNTFHAQESPIYSAYLLPNGVAPQGILSYCSIHLIAKA